MLLWSGQVVSTLGSTASSVVYPLLILIERIGAVSTVGVFALWYLLLAVTTTLNRDVRNSQPIQRIARA